MSHRSAAEPFSLPRLALDRPVTILVAFAAILVVGAVATTGIPIELIPRGFENPFLQLLIPWGDAPAEEVLEKITRPLEEEVSTVKGMDRVTSVSSNGLSHVMLQFKQGTDMAVAYREVRDRIERARRLFPEDVDAVFIRKDDPASLPAYVLGVAVDPDVSDPYEIIEAEIIRPLERLPGVASIQAAGHEQKEVLIDLDRKATEAAGLNIYEIASRLSDDNFTLASGAVEEAGRKLLISSSAQYRSLGEYSRLRVSESTRLGEIAEIRYAIPETDYNARALGRPAVSLVVFKEGDANGREVAALVAQRVDEIRQRPRMAGFETFRLFSQAEIIDEALSTLAGSGMIGGVLACLILIFFLQRLRTTLVVAAAIPLSLLLALTVMFFVGESLNMLSVLGLMICVGLLVDNSVVVAENIFRLHRSGLDRRHAVIRGTREMTLAITMSTLTTIVVFLPVALVSGTNQFFLLRLAIPVSVSLLASLAVALVFIPLCVFSTLPSRVSVESDDRRITLLERAAGPLYAATFGAGGRGYSVLLRFFLRRRLLLLVLTSALFLLSVSAVWYGVVPFVSTQRQNEAGFNILVEMPDGTTFRESERWFLEAERALDDQRDELGVEGWYLFHQRDGGLIRGWYDVRELGDLTARQATERLRTLLPEKPGVRVFLGQESQVANDLGEQFYQVELYGEDPELLEETASELELLYSRIDGVLGVQRSGSQQPNELGLVVDRSRMRRYGASPQVLAGLVSYALRGSPLPKFSRDGREVPVRIRYREEDRRNLQQLESFQIPTESGQMLPIGALTDARLLSRPVEIIRSEKRVSRTITLELAEGREQEVRERLDALLRQADLPEGVSFVADVGLSRFTQDSRELGKTVALSVLFIYFLMGVLFESVVLPLSILFTIPMAFIGVAALHFVVGRELDFLGAVSFVILGGVVVNNGIVLIDYLHRLRREGHSRDEAVLLAAERRYRPIMMTAITTIGGLFPLAFAPPANWGLSYTSFSLTLIGGMTTATLLTLLVIPVFYTLFDDLAQAAATTWNRGWRLAAPRAARAPESTG